MRLNLIFVLLILILTNCKKKKEPCHDVTNPDCDNYDPCFAKKAVSASFKIGQIWNAAINPSVDPYKAFSIDTVFPQNCSIKFSADIPNAYYTWYLGSEIIHDREFARIFDDKTPVGKYVVTLIVSKQPDQSCFPMDDGKDTVSRNFYIVNTCNLKTVDTYKGIIDQEADSTEWKLTFVHATSNWPPTFTNFCGTNYIMITGLNRHIRQDYLKDTVLYTPSCIFVSNKEIYIDYESNSVDKITMAHFDVNDPKLINFTFKNEGKDHTFRGIKK